MSGKDEPRREARAQPKSDQVPHPGRFAYDGLQRVLHEKARLGIMTSLISQGEPLAFSDLKELCALSDGNLNRHLEVLRESGFIEIEKTGAGRAAKSTCRLTPRGRESFVRYLAELEQVIADASRHAAEVRALGRRTDLGMQY